MNSCSGPAAEAKKVLKVILEPAALRDDEIHAGCLAAKQGGCNFVKTSTGFYPAGGASEHAIHLMKQSVGESLGIKASGGIRTLVAAESMIRTGATRLGLSATLKMIEKYRQCNPVESSQWPRYGVSALIPLSRSPFVPQRDGRTRRTS